MIYHLENVQLNNNNNRFHIEVLDLFVIFINKTLYIHYRNLFIEPKYITYILYSSLVGGVCVSANVSKGHAMTHFHIFCNRNSLTHAKSITLNA